MKSYHLIFLILLIFTSFGIKAQEPGVYVTHYVTYKDDAHPGNDLNVPIEGKIGVVFKDKDAGSVIVKIAHFSDKIMWFTFDELDFKGVKVGRQYTVYNGKSIFDDSTAVQIAFYKDKQGQLNLKISKEGASQLFYDLELLKSIGELEGKE